MMSKKSKLAKKVLMSVIAVGVVGSCATGYTNAVNSGKGTVTEQDGNMKITTDYIGISNNGGANHAAYYIDAPLTVQGSLDISSKNQTIVAFGDQPIKTLEISAGSIKLHSVSSTVVQDYAGYNNNTIKLSFTDKMQVESKIAIGLRAGTGEGNKIIVDGGTTGDFTLTVGENGVYAEGTNSEVNITAKNIDIQSLGYSEDKKDRGNAVIASGNGSKAVINAAEKVVLKGATPQKVTFDSINEQVTSTEKISNVVGGSGIYAGNTGSVKVYGKTIEVEATGSSASGVYVNQGSVTIGNGNTESVKLKGENALNIVPGNSKINNIDINGKKITLEGTSYGVKMNGYTDHKNESKSNVNIEAAGKIEVKGTYGILNSYNGGIVNLKAKEVEITGKNVGIWVSNNSTTKYNKEINKQDIPSNFNYSTVNIEANNTKIKVIGTVDSNSGYDDYIGLIAQSEGVLNIKGGLELESSQVAISTRGDSIVRINEANAAVDTKIKGDVAFDFSLGNSGTRVDSDVIINLKGKESSWTGNTEVGWYKNAGKYVDNAAQVSNGNIIAPSTFVVKGMKLQLSDGAQWNPTKIVEKGDYTDAAQTAGVKYQPLNSLEMNDGVINITEENKDAQVVVEQLTGNKGTINMVADARVEVGQTTLKALDVNGGNLKLNQDTATFEKVTLGGQAVLDYKNIVVTDGFTSNGDMEVKTGQALEQTGGNFVVNGNLTNKGTVTLKNLGGKDSGVNKVTGTLQNDGTFTLNNTYLSVDKFKGTEVVIVGDSLLKSNNLTTNSLTVQSGSKQEVKDLEVKNLDVDGILEVQGTVEIQANGFADIAELLGASSEEEVAPSVEINTGATATIQQAKDVTLDIKTGATATIQQAEAVTLDIKANAEKVDIGTITDSSINVDASNIIDEAKFKINTADNTTIEIKPVLEGTVINQVLSIDKARENLETNLAKYVGNLKGNASIKLAEGLLDGETTITANGVTKKKSANDDVANAVAPDASFARFEMNDIRKRMGDVRTTSAANGIWARNENGKLSGNGMDVKFNKVQVGYDKAVSDKWRIGGAFSYTSGKTESALTDGSSKTYSGAFYGLYTGKKGEFADVIARLGYNKNDIKFVQGGIHQAGDFSNNSYALSAEVGKTYKLKNNFYVEPQAELTYAHTNGADFSSNSVNYDIKASNSVIGRLGFSLGYTTPKKDGSVYTRFSVLREFAGDSELQLSSAGLTNTIKNTGKETWYELGLGGQIYTSKSTYVYADVEKTFGARLNEDYRFTIGMRYNF